MEMLVQSFISLGRQEWELHIYGDGNYVQELINITSQHKNVKYFGVLNNIQVIDKQMKAHLLVNPRLTDSEFIKYSFPSKTMEYMASGTPLISTALPGMPDEYYNFIYVIEDESEEGFMSSLSSVFDLGLDVLHKKGTDAKKFILESKNNIIQAKRVLNFLEQNF
jgi:glycosyltransferase involved in cell wall biosynthesis